MTSSETTKAAKKGMPVWQKIVGGIVAAIIIIIVIALWATSGMMDSVLAIWTH